ncbi:hypothetical protein P170DRAFT_95245 [Aspergillus steynii IBT 23096]|uniref:Uncharacterized protein n=1 Tax=Aspergillus steynii IBT 23096 TaxID=1392250 RepID=A0A2I2GGJ1_9EURO|nr:uncharacterized protein P170DRAFT_95245 [Aspergillus steynii IBT 23096]PLB51999.1 hypothetical protein P170DRAFT_95245 [Aspergillus steynii IBT 23096]
MLKSTSSRCLLHPTSVIHLCLTAAYISTDRTTLLLMRCFGAQATTCGLLLGIANMTRQSFTVFGLSMVPYLAFNAWFGLGHGKGVFTQWLWLDFVGNVTFGLGSLYCARLLGQNEDEGCKTRRNE